LLSPSLATVSSLNHFIDPISAAERRGRGGLGGGGLGKEGRKPVQISGVGGPEGCPWSHYVAYVLVVLGSIIICQLHKLTLSDKARVTLQLTFLSIRFSVKIFSWPAHAGGIPNFFLPQYLGPLSAVLYPMAYIIAFERSSEITCNMRICGLYGRHLNCSSLPAEAYITYLSLKFFPSRF